MTESAIISKIWNMANVLRDDGVSYGDYLEQITYLLFLKMADDYKLDAENFSDIMSNIADKIDELQESTTEISQSVEEISRTVGEAAAAVTTVAEKATDVANLSDGVVKVVGETEANSDELRDIKDSFTI